MTSKQVRNQPGTVTVSQASKLLMITPRRLRQLAADGHIPAADGGRYILAPVIQGYLKFLKGSAERRTDDNKGAGLASAKEREIRLRISQREASLVDAVDIERFHDFSSDLYRRETRDLGASVSRDPIIANLIDQQLASALGRYDARFAEAMPKLKAGIDPLGDNQES